MSATQRGRRRLAVAAGTVLACLAGAAPAAAAVDLDWQACGEAGAQCATATVPKDYDDPSAGTLDLAVAKSPATNPDKRSARCSSTSAVRARRPRSTSRCSAPSCSRY
jgi:hypothetical protein